MKKRVLDQRRFRVKKSVRPEKNEDTEESVPKRLRPEDNNLSLCFEAHACIHTCNSCMQPCNNEYCMPAFAFDVI